MKSSSQTRIVLGSVLFGGGVIAAAMVLWFALDLLASDLPAAVFWMGLLLPYLGAIIGVIVLMTGLKRVPDRVGPTGTVYHRAQKLLIWFGAVILVGAVAVFGVALTGAGAASLVALNPTLIEAVAWVWLVFVVVVVVLILPWAIIAVAYLATGITMAVRNQRTRRPATPGRESRPPGP